MMMDGVLRAVNVVSSFPSFNTNVGDVNAHNDMIEDKLSANHISEENKSSSHHLMFLVTTFQKNLRSGHTTGQLRFGSWGVIKHIICLNL